MSPAQRYLIAARFTLLEQARNRLAFFLLVIFVPFWYYLAILFTTPDETVAFKFRVTGAFLQVNARQITLISLALNAITLIIGFMFLSATRRALAFDRRLVLSGYPRTLLLLAKFTGLVLVALLIALYTSIMLYLFWFPGHPDSLPTIWLGLFSAGLSYGALGFLLGVLLRGELEGFFAVIMVSLIDTFIQNPIGNPTANKSLVEGFPAFGPTQVGVAGGFTHVGAWLHLLIALAWPAALMLLGLAVFTWKTRAWSVDQTAPQPTTGQTVKGSGPGSP